MISDRACASCETRDAVDPACVVQLPGQSAREKNSYEDRCNDSKRMTVSCHYDGEQRRECDNKNHEAERAGHRSDPVRRACPLYPRQRTFALHNSMSAEGQNLSSCVAHITLKRADRE